MRGGGFRTITRMATILVGLGLQPARADDPADYLFATSQERPEITIIDSSTDAVAGRISLPGIPGDIAVLGRGGSLAVADRTTGRVDLVDVPGRRVVREIALPVVADVLRSDVTGATLAALNLASGVLAIGSIEDNAFHIVSAIPAVSHIVFDVKGRLIATHANGATIVDAEGRQPAELAVDPANGRAMDIAADPGGEYAFVAQPVRGVVSVFDLHSSARLAVLHFASPLGRIIPSQDSQFVLVPSGDMSVSIVSTWTLKQTARLHPGVEPNSLGLALFQSVVTVISQSARKVILLDLRDEHRAAEIPLPGRPGSGAASADGSKLYVTLPDTGQVAAINLTLRRIDHLIGDAGTGVSLIIPAAGNGYCH